MVNHIQMFTSKDFFIHTVKHQYNMIQLKIIGSLSFIPSGQLLAHEVFCVLLESPDHLSLSEGIYH